MRLLFLTISALLAVFTGCASGSIVPYAAEPPVIRDISAFNDRLERAVAPQSFVQVKTLGEVVYGTYKAPIKLYSVYNRAGFKYKVFLSGGIHGNEPAGAETEARFIEGLMSNAGIFPSISFDIIPITNPWGWGHDTRYNADGKDINRDFATFTSQEARIISSYLEGKHYDLMIDDHEDPGAKGFYIYQYAMQDQSLARKVIGAVRQMGYPIEQNVNMVILKTDDGLIDAPLWGLWYMKATGQLSFPNYCRLYKSDRVYTVETPTSLNYEDRLAIHGKVREILLQDLLSK
jgi:murein peptide amidase A